MSQPLTLSDFALPPASGPQPVSRGGLRILCRLAQGGMAEVHLAECCQPGARPRLVVVKRMHPHHQDDSAAVSMFLDEARLALCLSHPNIVATERVGVFEGRHGIVMEFLEGQPLHQVLKRAYEADGALNVDVVVQIAIAALDGLQYAHALCDVAGSPLGVVHRDVSPQNLFVTYDGAVKLLDFGIAKNALQDGRTRTGMLKGKVSYMAPEQARGERVDRRADLWSLGVVLWEAVTGSRLFRGNNEAATLNLTLTEAVAPPSSRREDVPSEFEAILMRALRRNPDERYATAAEMRDELEAWLSSRELLPAASLSQLMPRLFAREIRDQRHQLRSLLAARLDLADESGLTLSASHGPASGTLTGLRPTQVSSVTELMEELTRQKRATTWLLRGLLALLGSALVLGACLLLWPHGPMARRAEPVAAARVLAPSTAAPPPGPTRETDAVLSAEVRAPRVDPPPAQVKRTARASAPAALLESPAMTASVTPSPEPGRLNLDTTPWSIVTLGGRTLGTTPLVGVSLPAGSHALVLNNPELGLRTVYQVNIAAGKTTARRVGLE